MMMVAASVWLQDTGDFNSFFCLLCVSLHVTPPPPSSFPTSSSTNVTSCFQGYFTTNGFAQMNMSCQFLFVSFSLCFFLLVSLRSSPSAGFIVVLPRKPGKVPLPWTDAWKLLPRCPPPLNLSCKHKLSGKRIWIEAVLLCGFAASNQVSPPSCVDAGICLPFRETNCSVWGSNVAEGIISSLLLNCVLKQPSESSCLERNPEDFFCLVTEAVVVFSPWWWWSDC